MAKALNVSLQVSADTGQAKQALQSLQQQLTQLTTTPANITIGGDIKKEALEASKAIAQLQVSLKNSTNSLTGNLNLTRFNQEMTQSGMSLQKYKTQLETMGPAGQKAFAQLASSIAQAEVPLRRTGGLLAEFWTTLKNTARWQISSSVLHGLMGAIQGAYSYAQDLNRSLNDIQIVTQASDDHMAQFAKSANMAAKQLSTTTTAYTKASLIYYQQGLNDKEVKERTDATVKMANVTGQTAQQVSDQMTAIWNNFDDGSHSLEYYADVITALGAATASSSEEISRGLEKFASIADTVGLSYENATAALATITATTRQSADTVGTGLRTLFSRLQSLKLGKTLEDGVDLTKYSKALKTIGVDVLDASGNLRAMDNILEDMGAKWQNLTDAQKTAVAQTVGGVRQYTTLMALMENFDFYKQNQQVAISSEGTLQKQQAIYEKSWEAASKRVRASAESIYSDLLDDKFFIKLTDGFSKFLDQIHNSIQAIGGLKGVLLAIGTVITTVFADKAATKLQNFINNIKSITPSGRAQVQALRAQGATMLQQSTMGQGFIGDHMSMAYAEQGQLQAAYLANAERMSAEQQSIAQALMQQQAALVENVQLEAQAAEQANKKATADTIATKRIINQNVQSKSSQTAMKDQISLITSEAKTVGKIDSFLGAFDGQKITNINQVTESLKRLKLSVTDFESYAPGAGQAFKQLMVAMKMDDADPRKIEEVQKALDKLNMIRGEGLGGAGLSLMVDNLKNLAQTQLPKEQYEDFCNTLDRLVSSAQSAGAAEQALNNTEGQLTGLTKMLSAAMDELAQKQYTLSQSIVNLVGGISSLAMAYNNLKGLKETWNNEDMSFGDKMLSTLTTLGPTLMMAQNGLSKMGSAILKIGSSVGTVIPAIGKAGTAIAGLGAKAGLMSSSVAAGAGAAAASFGIIAIAAVAAGFAIYKIAEAIETPQERLKRLSKEADTAQTAADEAKTAYENLLSLKSQHNELLQQLNTLTEGTHEFRDALIEANKVAREIIAANNFKYGVDYTIQDGKIIFNETSMKRAEEAAIQFEEATETSSLAASILQEGASNAITEANNYREADRSTIQTTGNYSNLILNPNATQIGTILTERNGSATTSNGEWNAQDIADIMGSEGALGQWNRAMEEYFYWLSRGNEGSYEDYWNYLKEQSEKEEFWTDAEYRDDRDAWSAGVGAMNLEQAQWYFDTYFKELFPEGTTLNDIGHGMLGEHDYVFEDPYTTGIRVANKSLSNALGIIADETNLGVAGDVVAEKLLQRYSDNNELTSLESQINEEINKNISNGQTLQQQYKDLFGKAADSEMSDSDIRNAIKQQKLWNKLYSEFTTEAQKFANVELGKYENFNKKNYGDLMSLIQEGYNAEGEDAEAYRIAADTLVRELSNSYAGLHDALGLSEGQEGLLLKFVTERNLSIDQINDLTKNLNNFNNAFGEQARNSVLHALTDSGYNTELSRILNNIDFSDTLSSLFDLKKAAKKYGIDKGVGKQLNDLYNDSLTSIGGEAGLLEELYKSENFKDSLEDLQKVYDKTGKIAASDILSAAKSNKLLNTYLEESNMQASTLAEILTMVGENGSLSIEQVSNALIAAINAATSLENGLATTFQFIDDFSLSRSAQDIGDFYKGLVDTFEKGIGQGNVGDKQIYEAYAQLFGKQATADLRQDFIRYAELAPGDRNAAFQTDHAAEIAVMKSIQERGDLSGLWGYYQEKGAFTDSGITWDSATYDLAANGDNTNGWSDFQNDQGRQIKTSNDYRVYVADELKKANGGQEVDPQLVESLIQDQLRENMALQDYLLGNDAQAGLQELLSSSLEQGLLNEQELATFYEQYEQYLKDENGNLLSLQDITKQFNQNGIKILKDSADYLDEKGRGSWEGFRQQVSDSGITTSKYFDQMGASRTALSGEVQLRSGGTGSSESQTVNLDEHSDWNKNFRDLDAYVEAVQKAGYSYQDAMTIAEESGEAFSRTVTNAFGETATYVQAAGESVEDFNNRVNAGINTSNIEAEAAIYAEAFKSAFTDVDMTVDATAAQEAFDALPDTVPVTVKANTAAADAKIKALAQTITVRADAYITEHYVNGYYGGIVPSYAKGSKNRKLKPGPALTGEEKPEIIWNPDLGYAYIVGQNGPEFTTLHPGDRVFNGEETAKILANSSTNSYLYGSYESGGYGTEYTFGGGSSANANNAKTSKYDPERYHLITRQLKDLQREYDRLDKIKENCYGTNKLEAIQREIDATDELIKGQKELIKEAEDYVKIDAGRLKGLLDAGEFQVDENGNLLNFEELQEKYRRKAEEDKDEHAQDIWKALQQYEETLDKLQEANVEMQDLLYQEMELRLEKIITKAELKIDFDEREIKLLDHYIKRIDDNIYHTAEVLALTEQKLGHINQKIEDTKEGINGLFAELSDSQGNKITKADGTAYTLEDWLAMSNEERDLLDINDNFGKQLEEYMDNLLDYIEELEEFKTKGVEEFADAFSELNDNVRSSIDLFDHYNQLLSSLKNITDLQGVKLSAELRAAMKEIDAAMFNNTQNNIDAERENYRRLSANVADLRQKIAETTDETLKKQWEEQLKVAEEELRTSEQNLLSLWETGLQQAKDMFEAALQDAADEYEATVAGMYGTTDELQKAWDQQKKNDDFYVKDFEKYYQIQKLQRSITKDLDAAAKAGNRQNKGLKKLYDDLNAARESGVELSSYDLDIFAKRYEYEKALMELEDARNNKSEVRLQRDANGNWGYVYTSSTDEDDLIAKQQAVDDKFYELQKATQERVASLSDDMMSEITSVGARLQELYSSGASEETIAKYLEQESKYIENYRQALAKALEDAGMTEEEARLRYGNEGFDILDQFSETLLSSITGGNESLDEFFARVQAAMEGTNHDMEAATGEYQDSMDAINKWFNESGEDLATVIRGFASIINEESDGNLLDSKEQIQNAKDTFDEILRIATQFEQQFLEIYQPIIDANEQLVADLLYALHALNREEYEGPDHQQTGSDISAIIELAEATGQEDLAHSPGGGTSGDGGNPSQEPSRWEKTGKYWPLGGDKDYHGAEEKDQYGNVKNVRDEHKWVRSDTSMSHGWYCPLCGAVKDWTDIAHHTPYSTYATGGYTGEWGPEGRMAMLHEKELILNKDDTKNFLDATNILRTIDLQTNMYSRGLGNMITPWIDDMKSQTLEQNVHIDASFPSVTDHNEIEAAFDNLINKATQYANRKNMSAMTFQDMYISKF